MKKNINNIIIKVLISVFYIFSLFNIFSRIIIIISNSNNISHVTNLFRNNFDLY